VALTIGLPRRMLNPRPSLTVTNKTRCPHVYALDNTGFAGQWGKQLSCRTCATSTCVAVNRREMERNETQHRLIDFLDTSMGGSCATFCATRVSALAPRVKSSRDRQKCSLTNKIKGKVALLGDGTKRHEIMLGTILSPACLPIPPRARNRR
jgi:hypothetical protein